MGWAVARALNVHRTTHAGVWVEMPCGWLPNQLKWRPGVTVQASTTASVRVSVFATLKGFGWPWLVPEVSATYCVRHADPALLTGNTSGEPADFQCNGVD